MIDLLLKHGANANAPAAYQRGATALQLAAITGQIGVMRILLDNGADANVAGARISGRTALEGAAEHGRIDTLQYLLTEGVQTTDTGRLQYLHSIRYAELEGHIVAADLLRNYRPWTVEDDDLWADLKGLSREKCEEFGPHMQTLPNLYSDDFTTRSGGGNDSEEKGTEEDYNDQDDSEQNDDKHNSMEEERNGETSHEEESPGHMYHGNDSFVNHVPEED
ncbi:hypothetical protein CSOJ01_15470 [Colletotrichum sojae]|uniref:Ankyrin repeat protein n=1 Tax=Colletotrichum sojae TaxID=2175907 RepID=A0A8H6IME2_9PEZI|nr:hypothetical protein CSOJ01_15470 [Colletotrichum sojae]